MQVGYGLVGDLAALAARLGRQDPVAAAAPALDVGAVHRALYLRRVPGVRKVSAPDCGRLVKALFACAAGGFCSGGDALQNKTLSSCD